MKGSLWVVSFGNLPWLMTLYLTLYKAGLPSVELRYETRGSDSESCFACERPSKGCLRLTLSLNITEVQLWPVIICLSASSERAVKCGPLI